MKKILPFMMFGMFAIQANAQTESPKQLEEDIVGLSIRLADKEARLARLKERTAHLEKRNSIKPEESDPCKWIESYRSVEALYNDSESIRKHFPKQYEQYKALLEMYSAFKKDGECSEARFKAINDKLKGLELPTCSNDSLKDDYKLTKLYFDDYNYTMSELARVFDVVDKDKTTGEKLLTKLRADDQTYYIDRIPYVKGLLEEYINSSNRPDDISGKEHKTPRERLRENLADAWPAAGFLKQKQ